MRPIQLSSSSSVAGGFVGIEPNDSEVGVVGVLLGGAEKFTGTVDDGAAVTRAGVVAKFTGTVEDGEIGRSEVGVEKFTGTVDDGGIGLSEEGIEKLTGTVDDKETGGSGGGTLARELPSGVGGSEIRLGSREALPEAGADGVWT